MRLFIAVNLPKWRAIQRSVQEQLPGRLSLAKDSHITLKFLGEVDDDRVHDVARALREVPFSVLHISMGEIDVFDSWSKPRVVFMKIEDHGKLGELVKGIDAALPQFKSEKQFAAHYTLARVKSVENGFKEAVRSIEYEKLTAEVGSFSLMRSELTPDGPRYTEITRFEA